jgi:hypothetical protein
MRDPRRHDSASTKKKERTEGDTERVVVAVIAIHVLKSCRRKQVPDPQKLIADPSAG